MSSAGNSSTSGASTRSSVSGSTPAQSTPLPVPTPTPTPTPTPAQPTPNPISNTPAPVPTPTPPTTQQQRSSSTTSHHSSAPSSTGWGNVPLDPGEHHGGRDHDDGGGSQTMQIVVPIVSTIAAVIFLVGAYRLVLYLRHRRQQKTSAPLPPPRVPTMLNRQSAMVDYRQSVMMDYDMVPPLLSASTSGHNSLQGSSRTVSSVGGRSPLLVNDQPITVAPTPFLTSSASSSSVPSEEYDYTKPIPRTRPRPISFANSVQSRHSVFTTASNRHSVHATPHRTSLRGAPHHSRIDIVLPEPLGPTSGFNQMAFNPPRMHRPPVPGEMGGLQPMRHPPPSRTSSRLRSYTPEDFDNESVTSPPSSSHHTAQPDYTLPPVPPLPPTLSLSPFLTPDTPSFPSSALTLPSQPSSSPNTAAAVLPVTNPPTDTTGSASNETPNASSSLPSPAEPSSPTTLTTTER